METQLEIEYTNFNGGTIGRKVKEIVQTYDRFQGVSIGVTVKAGAVNVLITLNHPEDLLFLKRRIAEIDGVVSIDIMAKLIAYLLT
jgi:hypothetical protein